MKKFNYYLILTTLIFTNNFLFAQSFDYVSPKDNSILVSLKTNIILKSTDIIDPESISQNNFSVIGSASGLHTGIIKLSDDNKTVLFIPATPFAANEDVVVNTSHGIKTSDGAALPEETIHFRTTPLAKSIYINPLTLLKDESLNQPAYSGKLNKSIAKIAGTDTTPSNFPIIKVDTSNIPAPGAIFLANDTFVPTTQFGNFVMILNNDGSAAKYSQTSAETMDFKVQPNGLLSYAQLLSVQLLNSSDLVVTVRWVVTDTTLTPIDSIQCGNGYASATDVHDFLLLPNGHAIVFADDPEPVDMSQYGGNPNATVIGVIIQELDASKNVVFQWRSWDYIPVTDSYMDLTTNIIDLLHGNSLETDANGNILFSMRHLSSVFKIDRQTGNVDWILGGVQNQFKFINEHQSNAPNYFSFQHDAKEVPDSTGYITLFDNGNQHPTPNSRAVEYKLDEQNLTATLVWEYVHNPAIISSAMGSVQRLSNGNTLIGWGYASLLGAPALTEIHPDLSPALELYLPTGQLSYRAYKFPWISQLAAAKVAPLGGILQGNTYKFNTLNDTTGITITFSQLNSALYANATVSSYKYAPVNPAFTTEAPVMFSNYFNISGLGIYSYSGNVLVNLYDFPAVTNPKKTIVYARSNIDSNFIPLPTSYDSTKNELTFTTTTLGDFAFGIPLVDSLYLPVPLTPSDSQVVCQSSPVILVWGTRGTVKSYHLQVSTNSSFSNLLVDRTGLTSSLFVLNPVNNNSTYYWRVNTTNAAGTSAWSNTETFSTAPAFIKLLSPDGGEKLYLDSTYVIRWESDISDTVNIKLMNGNNIASDIGDNIVGGTNAYQWQVPKNLKQGSTYQITVTSISNDSLYGISSSDFNISSSVTAVTVTNNIVKSFQLDQNYPNPFNPSTVIRYSIPQESQVRIDIYNIIGQRMTTLINSVQKSGNYEVTWDASALASGVYFYSIKAATNTGKNYFSVKKMILLK
jgi:hypothetical protein